MKVKVTKKQVINNYANIVCVGYCGFSQILRYFTPDYYTCGVYGWNADALPFARVTYLLEISNFHKKKKNI